MSITREDLKKLMAILEPQVKKEMEKLGLTPTGTSGNYGAKGKITFHFLPPAPTKMFTYDDHAFAAGLITPGAVAWHRWSCDGKFYLCRILAIRRKNYAYKWVEDDGITWVAPMNTFYGVHPKTKQAAAKDMKQF